MYQYEEKIELMRKYADKIRTNFPLYVGSDVPIKKVENAIKKFAPRLDKSAIIGFYDTTLAGNGKAGYIFTDVKVYYKEILDKPGKIWYDDIKNVEIFNKNKKDCNRGIRFNLKDGTSIAWLGCDINKTPLKEFFEKMLELINTPETATYQNVKYSEIKNGGAVAGGISTAAYKQVNNLYAEEKFHARQGHGFAAERANNLFDEITGHDARIVGDDNAKNGADRLVDGIYIQSKYYDNGLKCINDCFENGGKGKFRYMKNGKPMQIEVPSDKYDVAVEAMKNKIKSGQVEGITDPSEAENIVRKGHFTYEQAKNIAKAGTVESLTYDAVNGAIIATSAFGVTAVITLATNLWNGKDFEQSLKFATYSGLKVGGTAFITTIIASQLSKAGLNSALVSSSEAIIARIGPKASAIFINAFRSGSKIYGAAAMKSAAKLLRGNAITAGVTVGVLSLFDISNIFRGRISKNQLIKNLTNTTTTVAGGTCGYLAGAVVGSAILPGVGTVVGGVVGSIGAGVISEKATNSVLNNFIEDDADKMIKIIEKVFCELADDYLLNQKEAEKIVDRLSELLDGKLIKDMYASNDRNMFVKKLVTPLIEDELSKRKYIKTLTNDEMSRGLRVVLEEISDNCNSDPEYCL